MFFFVFKLTLLAYVGIFKLTVVGNRMKLKKISAKKGEREKQEKIIGRFLVGGLYYGYQNIEISP